ncbi:unnamed protein product, partial [Didymodactylos carnosus]
MSRHKLLKGSVSLTLTSGDDKIDRCAIVQAVSTILGSSDTIESIGNLGSIREWFIGFGDPLSQQRLLQEGELKVGTQRFSIQLPYQETKIIRLMGVPTSISDDEISQIVSRWGGAIVSVECENLPAPYKSIKTFVRRVRMRFPSKKEEEMVPISFKLYGLTVPVHLEGRERVCFRCKQSGHLKRDCIIEKCQVCYNLGHNDPHCQVKRTYASALAHQTPDTHVHILTPTPKVLITIQGTALQQDQIPINHDDPSLSPIVSNAGPSQHASSDEGVAFCNQDEVEAQMIEEGEKDQDNNVDENHNSPADMPDGADDPHDGIVNETNINPTTLDNNQCGSGLVT